MPDDTEEFMSAIISIVTNNNLSDIRIARKTSGLGATAAFAACCAGGVLFGPVGLAIGASVGGATAIKMTRKNTRSLEEFLNGLTKKQKKKLVNNVKQDVSRSFVCEIKKKQNILAWICQHDRVPVVVKVTVWNYLEKDLGMRIIERKK